MNLDPISNDFVNILHLDTVPFSVRFLKKQQEAKSGIVKKQLNVCQIIANARHQGRTSTGIPENMVCALGAAALGLIKTPRAMIDGTAAVDKYTKDATAGREFFGNTYKLGDQGKKYEAIEAGPLSVMEEFDVWAMYANPAQMLGLIHANSYFDGQKISADTVAEGALCSALGYAHGAQKSIVGFPCAGDRRFASTQHSELVFAAPKKELVRIHTALLELRKLGPLFPIPPMVDFESKMPPLYTIQASDLL